MNRVSFHESASTALRAAVRDALRDLLANAETKRDIDIAIRTYHCPRAGYVIIEAELGGNGSAGYSVTESGMSEAELRCEVSDRMQTFFLADLWILSPICAGHSHPMNPDIAKNQAVWRCPSDLTRAPIPLGTR